MVDFRPFKGNSQVLFAKPIPGDITVRAFSLPPSPRHTTRWDPNRPARELALSLSDGTRWTVTSRPCIEETPAGLHHGICFETRIERPDTPLHRRLTGRFRFDSAHVTTELCRTL